MFDRPDGDWEIIPFPFSVPSDEYLEIVDRWSIREFLRHFKPNYAVMSYLRGLLYRFEPVSRYTNDEVIDQIVARLVGRELLLRRRRWVKEDSGGGGGSSGGGGGGASPESDLPTVRPPKEDEPEQDTFPDLDGLAQALALMAAALLGIPFCDECANEGRAGS
jgi:hypothetical protein